MQHTPSTHHPPKTPLTPKEHATSDYTTEPHIPTFPEMSDTLTDLSPPSFSDTLATPESQPTSAPKETSVLYDLPQTTQTNTGETPTESYHDFFLTQPYTRSLQGVIVGIIAVFYVIRQLFQTGSADVFLASPILIWKTVFVIAGLAVGILFLIFDELMLHTYYQPNKLLKTDLQQADTITVSSQQSHKIYLISRSTLFLITYIPLAIFLYTSSGSAFGIAFVTSVGVGLATEMWFLRLSPTTFHGRFLQQLKRTLTPEEIIKIVWIFMSFVTLLATLTILRV